MRNDRQRVEYHCKSCGHGWDREVERNLVPGDPVRADTPGRCAWGQIVAVTEDQVLVGDTDWGDELWCDRWRVRRWAIGGPSTK
jgi:hypothetical protein